jgi:hypothetical protein
MTWKTRGAHLGTGGALKSRVDVRKTQNLERFDLLEV